MKCSVFALGVFAAASVATAQISIRTDCQTASCMTGTASATPPGPVSGPSVRAFASTFYGVEPNRVETLNQSTNGDSVSVNANVRFNGGGGTGGTSSGLGDGDEAIQASVVLTAGSGTTLTLGGLTQVTFEVKVEESADEIPLSLRGGTVFPSYNTSISGDILIAIDVGSDPVPYSIQQLDENNNPINEFSFEADDPTDIDTGNQMLTSGDFRVFAGGSASSNAPGTSTKTFRLTLTLGRDECCQPWDNGRFDRRSAQASQLAVSQSWEVINRYAADDFWLCEGQVHHINTIRGQLTTNSDLPKALVVLWSDCDGRPNALIAIAGLRNTSLPIPPPSDNVILGDTVITPTGESFDGYSIINVEASFDKLVLRGGSYWVSIIGFSADLDPLDEFFWGSAGDLVVKGRPGVVAIEEEWVDSDELCCGCTDYNFCVIGESCKILIDNGGPITGQFPFFPGVPSLQNGQRTADKSRAADKFVLPPCTRYFPCYAEGWLWTNCDRAALQLLLGGCTCPPLQGNEPDSIEADCVMDTGITIIDPTGVPVTLKKFQFFFELDILQSLLGRTDESGINVHFVLYGLGDNRQNARSYFAASERCDRECNFTFGPGCYRRAPADQNPWRSNDQVIADNTSFFPGFDHAFLVAVRDVVEILPPPVVDDDCPADVNASGEVTVQDIFDFLASWFAGCP